ncbi:MAG: S41 family peptidase [Ignavibacteriales bacterium]|nr:MAG: S41 family peptidase [Ignavibacteriales bacterium]
MNYKKPVYTMFRKRIIIALIVAPIIFTGAWLYKSGDIYFEIARNIDLFTRIYKEVTLNYVDDINPDEFLRSGIKGMLQNLDPYTVFIDEKRQDDIEMMTTGKYGGVGISVGIRDEKITIVEIMDGYSAQRQGLMIGDEIVAVDSVKLDKSMFDDVSLYVKGEPGTFVGLKIVRPGVTDTLLFSLVREEIQVKNVTFADFVPAESGTAYIKLSGFNRGAGDELRRSILNIQKKGEIKEIVLDLRGNPGGLLESAVDISSVFLPKGTLIVSTMGKDSTSYKAYFSSKEPILPETPLAVLVNGSSASASEIVAGAIQDHDRGIIVGERSFGKGLVQTISPLSNNTSLKITTSKYYTPSGRCIQKVDYAKDNKVITNSAETLPEKYLTDNKRTVFASGGILPDSSVTLSELSDFTRDLLAKGYIFRISSELIAVANEKRYTESDSSLIREKTGRYLKEKGYVYKPQIVKKLEEIRESFKSKDDFAAISAEFNQLISKAESAGSANTLALPSDGVREVLSDIINRQGGSSEKIRYQLRFDHQYVTSVALVKNRNYIAKILNRK